MGKAIREFLQVRGEYSMRNLTILITILVASVLVCVLASERDQYGRTQLTGDIFAAYLLAGAGVYSFGKWQDDKTRRFEIDSTPAPAPTTTINQPDTVNVPATNS